MANYGVDISKWQENIDFTKLAAKLGANGFAYIRAVYGDVTGSGVPYVAQDARFLTYWPAAKAARLRRGVYAYYHQGVSAGDQLVALLRAADTDWGELPPAVDIEQPVKDASGNPIVWTLTQNEDLQWFIWALAKCSGMTPMIYTSVGYWNAYVLPSYSGNPTPTSKDNTWARNYPLWIANWSVAAGSAPPLPQPWDKYAYHQYGKGKGADYGAESAEIDLDIEYSANPTPTPTYPTPKFQANVTSIAAGQSVTLSWSNTDGANEIRLNGSAQSGPTGSAVVTPSVNTTYSLFVGYPDAPSVTKTVAILVTPAPVPTRGRAGLGVHVLANGHSDDEANHPSAYGYAWQRGCRVFTIMNDQDAAAQYATGDPRKWTPDSNYPFIMYRQYHDTNPWSAQQMIDQLGGLLAKGNNNVVITLANEWDNGIEGASSTKAGMKKFCQWTIDCLNKLKARGFTNVAWLTSSMGTPEFLSDDVCGVIKDMIAPLWNSGELFWTDMHLYSPNKQHIQDDSGLIWYERRWEFLYTKCGFSPTAPGFIVSSETGLDEGGIGGYNAHGMSRDEVLAHCTRQLQVQQAPLVVNNVSYPSPFKAGTIYTGYDDDPKWGWGFGVKRYEPLVWRL